MSSILVAASSAAQSIIKNIVQNTAADDDKKLDGDYDPSNALDQSIEAKDKLEDSFGYDDSKEMEAEAVDQEEAVSDAVEEEAEVSDDGYASVEAEQYLDESVLAHVRKLASFQQEELVNNICDTYSSFNGSEPTVNDLLAIFGRIQRSLADEAAEDESEANDSDYDDENDSDYSPEDGEDNLQFVQDLQEDWSDVTENEESESDDAEDPDYDPNDAADLGQALQDEEEDNAATSGDDVSMESVQVDYAEESIINSESFDAEYFEAMESARSTARRDKAEILGKIKEEYQDVFGEEATNEIIMEAFSNFISSGEEEADTEEEDDEDGIGDEQYEDEEEVQEVDPSDMESALDNVRRLAKSHQTQFVDHIASTFKIINGYEPSEDDLATLFEGIQDQFADEIRDDFLQQIDEANEEEEVVESN